MVEEHKHNCVINQFVHFNVLSSHYLFHPGTRRSASRNKYNKEGCQGWKNFDTIQLCVTQTKFEITDSLFQNFVETFLLKNSAHKFGTVGKFEWKKAKFTFILRLFNHIAM